MKYTVKVYSNSEWDPCNAVYLELTPGIIDVINKARQVINDHPYFNYISVGAPDYDFVTIEDDSDDITKGFVEGEAPEQNIRYGSFRVSQFSVKYGAYGKHTGEEFFTDDLLGIPELSGAVIIE